MCTVVVHSELKPSAHLRLPSLQCDLWGKGRATGSLLSGKVTRESFYCPSVHGQKGQILSTGVKWMEPRFEQHVNPQDFPSTKPQWRVMTQFRWPHHQLQQLCWRLRSSQARWGWLLSPRPVQRGGQQGTSLCRSSLRYCSLQLLVTTSRWSHQMSAAKFCLINLFQGKINTVSLYRCFEPPVWFCLQQIRKCTPLLLPDNAGYRSYSEKLRVSILMEHHILNVKLKHFCEGLKIFL